MYCITLNCGLFYCLMVFSACTLEEIQTSLDNPITCHLQKSCTAIDCCVDVSQIGRFFHMFFALDPCTATLKIGIEKYTFDLSLIDYQWGVQEHFYLQGVVRIEWVLSWSFFLFVFFLSLTIYLNYNILCCILIKIPNIFPLNKTSYLSCRIDTFHDDWNKIVVGCSLLALTLKL